MKIRFKSLILALILVSSATGTETGLFPFRSDDEKPVDVYVHVSEHAAIKRAVGDLAGDIAKVIGSEVNVFTSAESESELAIVVGQVGAGGYVDQLVEQGLVDFDCLQTQWEAFVIEGLPSSTSFAKQKTLVIAGSDMRGTIYAIYEVSKKIGVSPWHWWADVPVIENPDVTMPGERLFVASPSVKYRGIFINDEDWGLQPWAAETFDQEFGDLGPKTYAKVFELLLRLRANCLWPAMHKVSRPFNDQDDIRNAELANDYGIIMSSSHAEPMLRNNVREWTRPHKEYNYQENAEGVRSYWEERLITNGAFENIYTLGMRGIHDSGMRGGSSLAEQCDLIEQIIGDQRDLLKQHVKPDVTTIPQTFVAYKEVLSLYRNGLQIPDDVTVVWPDDNFGFIRNFAQPAEINRSGAFGVYYHISYLGSPMAYLWLNTTPPALIWQEMTKAYAWGATNFWMLNVGDIKPAEIGMDFFFKLAWDIDRWDTNVQPEFLREWAFENFPLMQAPKIADVLDEFYDISFQRKPEHLQFHMPLKTSKTSDFSIDKVTKRLEEFEELETRVENIADNLSSEYQDSYFELVAYPVKGSNAANLRYFQFENYLRTGEDKCLEKSKIAHEKLLQLTEFFNQNVADGKWNRFIQLEPADNNWRSMRIGKWSFDTEGWQVVEPTKPPVWQSDAVDYLSQVVRTKDGSPSLKWKSVDGLGRSGKAMVMQPFDRDIAESELGNYPVLQYQTPVIAAGHYQLDIELLPTFPIHAVGGFELEVVVDGGLPTTIFVKRKAKSVDWKYGVVEGYVTGSLDIQFNHQQSHQISIKANDASLVIDRLVLKKSTMD